MNPLACLQKESHFQAGLSAGIGWLDSQGKFFSFDTESQASETALPIVWVPTTQVLLLSAKVPGKRASQWQQALPYALEDQLAESVEALHFAVYHREKDGTTYCAVVNKQKMQQWVDEITAQGHEQAMLLPDIFQLPDHWPESIKNVQNSQSCQSERVWFSFQGADQGIDTRVWVRQGAWQGFETTINLLPLLRQKSQVAICSISSEVLQHFWQEMSANGTGGQWQRQLVKLDLRQGAFRSHHRSGGQWQKWALPSGLAAAILLVSLGRLGVESHWMRQQAQHDQQQTIALFKQLFPNVKRIVNLTVQTKQQLQALQQTDQQAFKPVQFLKQTQKLWPKSSQVKLQQVRWQNQKLVLQVQSIDLEAVNRLVQALQKRVSQSRQTLTIQFKVDQIAKEQVTGKIYVEQP